MLLTPAIKFAVGTMAESLYTFSKASLEISLLRLLFGSILKNSHNNDPKRSLEQFTLKTRIQLVGPVLV